MSENMSKVRTMVAECYVKMDADALTPILHPDARHTAPGSDFGTDLEGRATIVEYFRKNVFPSFNQVDFEIVFAWEDKEKNVVVAEWRSHLWPKTGKEYRNTGAWVVEMRDGLIYWVREYFDTQKANQNVN